MTAQLCHTRPPEYWDSGNAGNRLALLICGQCTGCPEGDPKPHGVIRQGVAYSDEGLPLPPCSNCGAPNLTYTGGDPSAKVCSTCVDPKVWLPDLRAGRRRWALALREAGVAAHEVAAETGLTVNTVWQLSGKLKAGQVAA
jgi:hypothetical protein